MSSLTASTDFTLVQGKDLDDFVSVFAQDVVHIVNGSLDFDTNFNAKEVTVNFTSANADTSVGHGLGRVPTRYIMTSASAAMSIYAATIASTSNTISLRSSAIGTATVLIY